LSVNPESTTRSVTWLTLFASGGTLICCALPALLVALGAGATLASLATHIPALVWVSEHKNLVFALAGSMLVAAGFMQWRARRLPCPADPALARACTQARTVSRAVYFFAVAVFALGGLFAYVLPALNA
jgi:glycerol kinase